MLKNQFSQIKKFLIFKNKKLMPFFGISFFIFLLIFLPLNLKAEMQSSSYVIYENVMHSFDGPIISAIGDSVSGQTATISWTTNVNADSFVIYDTDNTFVTSREQGSSDKSSSAHSVELNGLSANTTYYYRVRSERVNGGITTDSSINSFTTGSDDTGEEPVSSGGGGGILIIDKTDEQAPIITNVETQDLDSGGIEVSWETDEEATSFVEYGLTESYGTTYGSWGTSTNHAVNLNNLEEDALYYYRALSSDSWGNLAYSEQGNFYTGKGEGFSQLILK